MKEKIAKFMARPITSVKAMDDASFPDENLEGDEE